MVRRKNVLATMAQSVAETAVVSLLWFAVGYSLAFRGDGAVAWCVIGAWIALRIVDAVLGLRVSPEQEREGLDVALHGEAMRI